MVLLIQELVRQWSHIDPGIIRKGSQLTIPFNRIQHYFPSLIIFVEPPSFLTSTKFFRECGGFWHYMGVCSSIRIGVLVACEPILVVQGLTSALNTCQWLEVNLPHTPNWPSGDGEDIVQFRHVQKIQSPVIAHIWEGNPKDHLWTTSNYKSNSLPWPSNHDQQEKILIA